uniref:Uncharacterized protein n=1 Tax=Arundo donax TaxID=35708 RepID=A0A0A8Z822_ARUDO
MVFGNWFLYKSLVDVFGSLISKSWFPTPVVLKTILSLVFLAHRGKRE